MDLTSRCLLCNKIMGKNNVINLKNLPSSAQGFENKVGKLKINFSANLYQCNFCNHVQLDSAPVDYYKNVIRSVGISPSMKSFRENQFLNIKKKYFQNYKNVKVLEVGSASGEYSEILNNVFHETYSTEKNRINFELNIQKGINCIDTHPDEEDFLSKLEKYGPFDLICCFSYLEHLPSPNKTLNLFKTLLSEKGFLLIELPNSEMIFRKGLLNEIIPDHISYFTINTATALMSNTGFEVINSNCIWEDYIITLMCRKQIEDPLIFMEDKFREFNNNLNYLFKTKLNKFNDFVLWGAGHQALFTLSKTILKDYVKYIVDSSPSKQNLYAPGSALKIYSPNRLISDTPEILIIACAGYNKEVFKMVLEMQLKIKNIYFLDGITLEKV